MSTGAAIDKMVGFILKVNPKKELMSQRDSEMGVDPMRVVELLNQSQELVNSTNDISVALSRLSICYDCILWMAVYAEHTSNIQQQEWVKNAVIDTAGKHEELMETLVYRWTEATILKNQSFKTQSTRDHKNEELKAQYHKLKVQFGIDGRRIEAALPVLSRPVKNQEQGGGYDI